ncbi:MAG: glycosyltransferase family 4 protein [Gammaproteobacteria bacterium]|nr:glycosyltransferase family 4 protein [Gammaproteobacteria bacterium]
MHIVLTIASLETGGAERILCFLANHWVRTGHKVSLITLKSPDSVPFYFLEPSVNLTQLNQSYNRSNPHFSFLINSIKCLFSLRKTLKKLNADVVVSFMDLMNIATLLANVNLKYPVIVCERTDPNCQPLSCLYQWLRWNFYPRAYKIATQTASAASYFTKKLSKKITIIPNPIFEPSQYKTLYTEGPKNIVTVGRLDIFKDHRTLIYAFSSLLSHHSDLMLTIYGEGVERKNLERLIQTLHLQDKVKLPGTTTQVQAVLLEADLFIFPSRYEGFPNALCEAMAVGLPVIASNVTGNVDLVQDKKNGRLFPVGDVQALTNLALELLNDPTQCQALGTQARRVSEDFKPEAIFARWDALIAPLG